MCHGNTSRKLPLLLIFAWFSGSNQNRTRTELTEPVLSVLVQSGSGSGNIPTVRFSVLRKGAKNRTEPNFGNTTAEWIEDTNWAEEQNRLHRLSEEAAAEQEELDYQAAVARSLDLPVVTQAEPGMSLNIYYDGSMAEWFIAVTQSSSSQRHRAAPITRHMNSEWMRPFEDNTKKSPIKRKRTGNPDQQFCLVFWAQSDVPSDALAVHECPDWPTWSLCDSPNVQKLLGITKTEHLQFYNITHAQWVTCLPSYPHQVSKTRHLLLRCMNVTVCPELDKYLATITEVPTHMWRNMANEQSTIKHQLLAQCYKKINIFSPPSTIDLLGDSDRVSGKRKAIDFELDETPLRQCQHLSPSSPISVSDSPTTPMPRQNIFGSISGESTPLASYSRALSQNEDISGNLMGKSGPLACTLFIWLGVSGE
ncbi:hypothetical protein HYPSUDRAFT_59759 [Hypholoma sublateritium FD-334 SS-4]|uniref:Uncharacterized protein n=1 Tax=Hypholoma sublateritium (strain FD-334 SS-4) TaxID=945553 RepID=A0A0D2KGS0_HYPSF|nr:hypothetical protein HYPSUDRAFT_59759 [Hypholoma sublateritium FD-334 SS-4]